MRMRSVSLWLLSVLVGVALAVMAWAARPKRLTCEQLLELSIEQLMQITIAAARPSGPGSCHTQQANS